jgi:quinolinate synthase
MAMNSLYNLADVLETMDNEIIIDENVRKKAVVPLERMLAFNAED